MNKKIWNEKPTYQNIKNSLIELLVANKTSAREDLIEFGLQSLQRLEKDERVVSIIYKIDKICPPFQKIPSILTTSILLDKYKEKTERLTDDELTFLSIYSSVGDLDYKRECIEKYNHQVLNEICKKTTNIYKRVDYLTLLESKFLTDEKSEMIEFIKEKNTKELDQMISQNEIEQTLDEVAIKEKLSL